MGFEFQADDVRMLLTVAVMGLGVRLLSLARRNRGAAELLLGLYLLVVGPATSLSMRIERFSPEYQRPLEILSYALLALSMLCLCAFAWRVFRPHATWAKVLAAVCAALYCGQVALALAGVEVTDEQLRLLWGRLSALPVFGWVFFECVLYHRRLVRRMRLGLADPVVANRFLLFAIWSGALALLPGITLLVATLLDLNAGQPFGGFFAALVSLTGIVIYVALWLSFLPPKAYTRWIRHRHAGVGAEV